MTRVDDGKACFTISNINDLLRIATFAMNLKALITKLQTRYLNSVHTRYQHFAAKKCLSANCICTNGNEDTVNLDILNDQILYIKMLL